MKHTGINKTDLIVLSAYVLLWLILCLLYSFSILEQDFINNGFLVVGLLGPVLLYTFYYRRLRMPVISFMWLFVGLVQIMIMLVLQKNLDFMSVKGTYAHNLIFLPCMIISLSLMRWLYRLFFNQELIITSHSREEDALEDGRKLRPLDYILSILGVILFTFVPTLLLL